jgi:hypothetical protein
LLAGKLSSDLGDTMYRYTSARHGVYECSDAQLAQTERKYNGLSLAVLHDLALERSDVDFTDVQSLTAMMIIMGEWEVVK